MPRVSKFCVFLSLSLSLSLIPAHPPFPRALSSYSLNCGGLSKTQKSTANGGFWRWRCVMGKSHMKKEIRALVHLSLRKKQHHNNQITMNLICNPSQTSSYTCKPLHKHWHLHTHKKKHKYKHTNRDSPDSLSQRLLDCVLLHSWPLPCVLFICG